MSRAARGRAGNQLRIIGGRWRGRKLGFTPAPGLRPTGDRIRETLFNWLASDIHGAHCLDLFAGSGALGLESLSRGAAYCDFVDTSGQALADIQGHLETLSATDRGHCHQMHAADFLARSPGHWNILFLDPPFGTGLMRVACEALALHATLAPGTMIYVEAGLREPLPALPRSWELYRDKSAGEVRYSLFVVGSGQKG